MYELKKTTTEIIFAVGKNEGLESYSTPEGNLLIQKREDATLVMGYERELKEEKYFSDSLIFRVEKVPKSKREDLIHLLIDDEVQEPILIRAEAESCFCYSAIFGYYQN